MASVLAPDATVAFSFVVPARNEVADVGAAIRSAEAAAVPGTRSEVIVIDDASTDGTRRVLRRYAREGRIILIEHDEPLGAATSRNDGLRAATGDVAIFMDADNVVPPDFLVRLRSHYLAGADFVSVESEVVNQDTVVGRFQQAAHELAYGGLKNVGYSQSFSCRRDLATRVGFHPGLSGSEDGEFFDRLPLAESIWIRDAHIVVGHRVPDTLRAFWRQHRWRGSSSVLRRRSVYATPLPLLIARSTARAVAWCMFALTVVPAFAQGVRLVVRSPRGLMDLPPFLVLWCARGVARRIGEFAAILDLWRGTAKCP